VIIARNSPRHAARARRGDQNHRDRVQCGIGRQQMRPDRCRPSENLLVAHVGAGDLSDLVT